MGYIPPPMPRDPRLLPAYIDHCERAAREERAAFVTGLWFVSGAAFGVLLAAMAVVLVEWWR